MQISDTDDSDCNMSVYSFFEPSVANIAAESERLVIQNKSLLQIIKRFQDDVAASEKTIALINNENIKLKRQVDLTKDFSTVVRKRNSPPLELVNRFTPLTADFPPHPDAQNSKVNIPRRAKLARHPLRVLIIWYIHARGCSSEQLGHDFSVSGIVKPNARLCNVVRDVGKLAVDFNKKDHIVVFG